MSAPAKGSQAFAALHEACRAKQLTMRVEARTASNGQGLLRIRITRPNGTLAYSAPRPARAGRELDTQALALLDALRRRP